MRITYIATDEIASGHIQGNEYSFEVALSSLSKNKERDKKVSKSLNGTPQVLDFGSRDSWNIKTINVKDTELDLADECFSSILDGQLFTFDPTGTIATPSGEEYTCYVEEKKLKRSRLSVTDYFSLSLNLRIIS